jgi:hypothetical protein
VHASPPRLTLSPPFAFPCPPSPSLAFSRLLSPPLASSRLLSPPLASSRLLSPPLTLTIFGVAQAAVRDEEATLKARGDFPNQYGFIGEAKEALDAHFAKRAADTPPADAPAADAPAGAPAKGGPGDEGTGEAGSGLDAALSAALGRMHRKLDASVSKSVSGLEMRLLRQLAELDRQGGHSRTRSREKDRSAPRGASGAKSFNNARENASKGKAFKGKASPPGRMSSADYQRVFGGRAEKAEDRGAVVAPNVRAMTELGPPGDAKLPGVVAPGIRSNPERRRSIRLAGAPAPQASGLPATPDAAVPPPTLDC